MIFSLKSLQNGFYKTADTIPFTMKFLIVRKRKNKSSLCRSNNSWPNDLNCSLLWNVLNEKQQYSINIVDRSKQPRTIFMFSSGSIPTYFSKDIWYIWTIWLYLLYELGCRLVNCFNSNAKCPLTCQIT